MEKVITIGLDIAKSVFQVHGVDGAGAVVIRKRISRARVLVFFADLPPCLIGIEACPSAHHWGRELQALGHTVRLMPPSYVKALSLSETLYGWRVGANRVMLMPDGRCSHVAVVSAHRLVSLKSSA